MNDCNPGGIGSICWSWELSAGDSPVKLACLSVVGAAVVSLMSGFAHAQLVQPPVDKPAGTPPAQPTPTEFTKEKIPVPAGVKKHEDLAYVPGGHALQKLDLYVPASASGEPLPLVVWVHSGNWKMGDKENCPGRGWPAKEGAKFAVASVNYRLTPEVGYREQVQDIKAAIRYLREQAKEYGIDGSRVAVWGISAGAHLAALTATTSGEKEFEPGNAGETRVQACGVWFGPMDLSTFSEASKLRSDIDALLSGGGRKVENRDAEAKAASPIAHVTKDDPAFVFYHGEKNDQVPVSQSGAMNDALSAASVKSTLVVIPNQSHGFRPQAEYDKHVEAMRAWFGEVMKMK